MSKRTQITFSGYQHLGRRTTQEDRFYTDARVIKGVHIYILAVADGMGGHKAGDLAAEIAIQGVRKFFSEINTADLDFLKSGLAAAFFSSNEKIRHESANARDSAGMGTTLTCALAIGNKVFVCHVGDSRAYLITNDNIYQCTKDHTAYQDGIDKGMDVGNIKIGKHALTRCMDGDSDFKPDLSKLYDFNHGQLLICSDGVYGALDNSKIQRIANSSVDAHACAKNVVEAAMERGASDNVTAACLAFQKSRPASIPVKSNKIIKKKTLRKSTVILSILMLGALTVTGWGGYKYFEMNNSETVATETEFEITTEDEVTDEGDDVNYIDNRNEIALVVENQGNGVQVEINGITTEPNEQEEIGVPETNGDQEMNEQTETEQEQADLDSEDENNIAENALDPETVPVEEEPETTDLELDDQEYGFDGEEQQNEETASEENEVNVETIEVEEVEDVTQSRETEETVAFGFDGVWQAEANTGYCIQAHTLDDSSRVDDAMNEYSNRDIRARAFPSKNRPDATMICLGQFETEEAAKNCINNCDYNFNDGSKVIRISEISE